MRLPLDFAAFCALHYARYVAYCQVRLHQGDLAEDVAQSALGALAVGWREALASSPAATGWRVLGEQVTAAAGMRPVSRGGGLDLLYRRLSVAAADAVVLHHGVGLSVVHAADVTGRTPEDITAQLAVAERCLGPDIVALARATPSG